MQLFVAVFLSGSTSASIGKRTLSPSRPTGTQVCVPGGLVRSLAWPGAGDVGGIAGRALSEIAKATCEQKSSPEAQQAIFTRLSY